LLWQVGFLGEPISSLGLKKKFIKSSIITGFISGCVLGLVGGNILKFFGITGYDYSKLQKSQYLFGLFNIPQLQKELGYQILTMSNNLLGVYLYLMFCIFIIGLGEELFWRGFVQKKISKRFSKIFSIWLTATLFSLVHLYIFIVLPIKAGIFFLALIAIVGAFWGYLFEYFNNIWAPAISHGLIAFIIWKYYFFTPLFK
jgi:membrane protease YdiL (CAAX protease family)